MVNSKTLFVSFGYMGIAFKKNFDLQVLFFQIKVTPSQSSPHKKSSKGKIRSSTYFQIKIAKRTQFLTNPFEPFTYHIIELTKLFLPKLCATGPPIRFDLVFLAHLISYIITTHHIISILVLISLILK